MVLFETGGFPVVTLVLLVPFLFFNCCSRKPDAPKDAKKSKMGSVDSPTVTGAQDSLIQKPTTAPVEKKQKSGKSRRELLDSIKIIRGKKNVRKARTLEKKKDDTDSQHTELINVPLGKAAESTTAPSKLTAPSQQKALEKAGDQKKIQFAQKIVKSTKSPDTKNTTTSTITK